MDRYLTPVERFIVANTALAAPALVPELKLRLANEEQKLLIWQQTEVWLGRRDLLPPYWAFCWPGGEAVARYLLDNPATVAGQRVIDLGAGGGVVTVAAARAGAAATVGNDIDRLALVCLRLNAEANGVAVEVSSEDWLAGDAGAPDADVVTAGDIFYGAELTMRALAWLRGHAAKGRLVLLGDPGRRFLATDHLEMRASYAMPATDDPDNRDLREITVWRVRA
ncbi:MAG: methyltransferase [Alphaproteobacteria bacterium]|nr:methyltransferase [Alphaproteobacteria bacterium]